MTPPAWFFNKVAEFDSLAYPQDAAGGEVPTPSVAAILIPCCVQSQLPERTETQAKRGSTAPVSIFFAPGNVPIARQIIGAMKVNDRIKVRGYKNPIILDGPAADYSGHGAVFEAPGKEMR